MKSFKTTILHIPIYSNSYSSLLKCLKDSIEKNKQIYICVAAVHLIMEAQKNKKLLKGLQNAQIVTSDGMPLVWISKLYGNKNASRIYGPNLTLLLCKMATKYDYKIFLLGGAKNQSKKLGKKLGKKFPNLKIVGSQDTPTRPIPDEENNEIIKKINKSHADIVFVGMGCPNQEFWMIENRSKLSPTVLIGVGAAFDFITGEVKQAPEWMQNSGLEWLYRLVQEPKRLWKRYIILNTLFVMKISRQLLRDKLLGKI